MLLYFNQNSQQHRKNHFRVVPAAPTGSSNYTAVEAAVYLMGSTSGSNVLVTNGFPLPKGAVSFTDVTDRKIQIFVEGTEKQCYVEAMPGKHPDGTVRSLYVQFYHDINTASPITAELRYGSGALRETTDLLRITASHDMFWKVRPSASWGYDADPTAAFLPTNPTYLCSTDATFQQLSPASLDDAEDLPRFQTHFEARMNALRTNTNQKSGLSTATFQSTYDIGRGLLSHWCRTGNVQWWKDALTVSYRLLEYMFPTSSYNGWSPNPNVFNESRMKVDATYVANSGGDTSEQMSQRQWTYAAAWQASGYVPFFGAINLFYQNNNRSTRATYSGSVQVNGSLGWIEQYYGIRSNVKKMGPILAAYCIGATRRMTSPSGLGNRDMNMAVELPYILDAIYVNRWNRGDWRDEFCGIWQGNTDGTGNGNTAQYPEDWPTFQIPLINGWLQTYQREVYADPRIPDMIRWNVNTFLMNTRAITSASDNGFGTAFWGTPYWVMRTIPACSGAMPVQCYYNAELLPDLAYCMYYFPSSSINGATYETWYTRFVDPVNNANNANVQSGDYNQWPRGMKIMGEQFGYAFAAPAIKRNGVEAGPTSILAIPTASSWPTI